MSKERFPQQPQNMPEQNSESGETFSHKELVEKQYKEVEDGSGKRDFKEALRTFTPPGLTPEQREKEIENRDKFGGEAYKIGDQVLWSGRVWYVDSIVPKQLSSAKYSQINEDFEGSAMNGTTMRLVKKPEKGEDITFKQRGVMEGDRLYVEVSDSEDVVQKATPEALRQMDKMKNDLPAELSGSEIMAGSKMPGSDKVRQLKSEIEGLFDKKKD